MLALPLHADSPEGRVNFGRVWWWWRRRRRRRRTCRHTDLDFRGFLGGGGRNCRIKEDRGGRESWFRCDWQAELPLQVFVCPTHIFGPFYHHPETNIPRDPRSDRRAHMMTLVYITYFIFT
jgi:hypothetical protein